MRKWNSVLTACAAATLFIGAADDTYAQQRGVGVDGCAVLADAVYGEIFVSALFGSYRLPPEPGQGDSLSCEYTAAAASAGFSRAMAAMNVYVTWAGAEAPSSTICTTGDLALCTPVTKPLLSGGALDAASVAEMWRLVSNIVSRNMPLGTMSDRTSFREYELRIRLSDALVNRFWNAYGRARPRTAH
ncbi:MAG: hypothetical protein QNI99_11035 [Woeseiaceae bacterium]|nr:hypothetical protein [Woeseiaceae bacterium]